jgi:hypothetical protein
MRLSTLLKAGVVALVLFAAAFQIILMLSGAGGSPTAAGGGAPPAGIIGDVLVPPAPPEPPLPPAFRPGGAPGAKPAARADPPCDGWDCADAMQGASASALDAARARDRPDPSSSSTHPAMDAGAGADPVVAAAGKPDAAPAAKVGKGKSKGKGKAGAKGGAAANPPSSAAAPPPPPPTSDYRPRRPAAGGAGAGGGRHVKVDYFSENRARGAADLAAVDGSSMTRYIQSGGRFPLLLVTCDRAEMLAKTLDALLKVRGVTKEDIYVVQDGSFGPVRDVLESKGVRYHQKTGDANLRGGPPMDGAARIATHYNYALTHIFSASAFPNAPAAIVVEDDFVFAPDFYEYFHAVAPLLEADPTTWIASAWNDNGFDYLVADPYAVRRTRYFPGLGWLLPRRLYEGQLQHSWPQSHWDHWMRDPAQHRGRDILYPEIPRDYHAGVKGTFMDGNTHNRYFGSIAMQADPDFTWDSPVGATAIEDTALSRYEARLRRILTSKDTTHLSGVDAISAFAEGTGVVWYDCPPNEPSHDKMRAVAGYFGIWHEGARGSRDGVHELWWMGKAKLVLVNVHPASPTGMYVTGSIVPSSLRGLMPSGHRALDWSDFLSASRPQLPKHNDLFGATTSSPLAHLDGGNDANGAPDMTTTQGGGGVVVYTRETGWEHEGEEGEAHDHSHFMGDLKLKVPAARAGKARSGEMAKVGALPESVHVVASTAMGASCNSVCAAYNGKARDDEEEEEGEGEEGGAAGGPAAGTFTCAASYLPVLNDCSTLRANFDCASCTDSIGADQPALVDRSAPADKGPGTCLVNSDPSVFSCEGVWSYALRLCPCQGDESLDFGGGGARRR